MANTPFDLFGAIASVVIASISRFGGLRLDQRYAEGSGSVLRRTQRSLHSAALIRF